MNPPRADGAFAAPSLQVESRPESELNARTVPLPLLIGHAPGEHRLYPRTHRFQCCRPFTSPPHSSPPADPCPRPPASPPRVRCTSPPSPPSPSPPTVLPS